MKDLLYTKRYCCLLQNSSAAVDVREAGPSASMFGLYDQPAANPNIVVHENVIPVADVSMILYLQEFPFP